MVLTEGALRMSPAHRGAVLAHEGAHLTGRHHLITSAAARSGDDCAGCPPPASPDGKSRHWSRWPPTTARCAPPRPGCSPRHCSCSPPPAPGRPPWAPRPRRGRPRATAAGTVAAAARGAHRLVGRRRGPPRNSRSARLRTLTPGPGMPGRGTCQDPTFIY
ncbi:hypothetical protein ACFQ1I_37645 [Kitasatospora arboriphila]